MPKYKNNSPSIKKYINMIMIGQVCPLRELEGGGGAHTRRDLRPKNSKSPVEYFHPSSLNLEEQRDLGPRRPGRRDHFREKQRLGSCIFVRARCRLSFLRLRPALLPLRNTTNFELAVTGNDCRRALRRRQTARVMSGNECLQQ